MFKFSPAIFALLLSQASASTTLRTDRQLSEELFISYEPQTTVTDHAAIDLDQQAIETQLAAGTGEGKQNARNIYTQGAYSKSYAEITLDTPLASGLSKGTAVTGQNADGDEIAGALLEEAAANANVVKVQYSTTSIQDSYVGCQVGGNPDPVLDGCLAPTGTLTIGSMDGLSYTYNPKQDNKNARTIQGFSTQAREKMYDCGEKCPYKTYEKFYNYYQAYDYGDKWVQAGFDGGVASFENGSADFTGYQDAGITEVIKKGTAYLNIWMYVNRELEDAIDDCENSCPTTSCNDDQVHAWDEAVAFYTGSIPKKSGDGGVLLYTLAQKRCENFGTCIPDGKDAGMAYINQKIFRLFNAGKQSLQSGQCAETEKIVDEITSLMTIPMIQGTLRYAHIIGEQNGMSEKAEAEGATFAAAVLPILHDCNAADATTVYNNMRTGSADNKDFAAVKKAFENNYGCMKVSCVDVGGLLQADAETYFPGAEPCGQSATAVQADSSSAFEFGVSLAAGITAGVVAALI